ncbi:uncharacterized protein LOC122513040 [Leptopilina heterotoma]|uniref:uncharacterized protein LOC122500957 n=1 Tax=Leptopilina heterotoma TaxID=63436 RepID=UPI001CA9E9B6|nr:uncharacterized protein LOC122500957 [Leptopilina heterotoma]XP_043480452.1 uncharacterized protein LOC122510103 [Leptopilina heterotoma]XP_043485206.1 uncharacterized protein LOC122513039 [Leptopilina heterotoma]XP_043485207.1 uncharacterized protein LOC122513040 [Leptopilina heterotoma]
MSSSSGENSSSESDRRHHKKRKRSSSKNIDRKIKKAKKELKKLKRARSRTRASSSSSASSRSVSPKTVRSNKRHSPRGKSPLPYRKKDGHDKRSRDRESRSPGRRSKERTPRGTPYFSPGKKQREVSPRDNPSTVSGSRSRSRSFSRSRSITPSGNSSKNSHRSHQKTNQDGGENVAKKDASSLSVTAENSMLMLLGEGAPEDAHPSEPIHNTVADLWIKILQFGLPPDASKALIKKYQLPENCLLMGAPQLNQEIKSGMGVTALKKDQHQVTAQNKLGAAISALGQVLTVVLQIKKESKDLDAATLVSIFSTLCDIGRILTDIQHGLSMTRRSFIVPTFSILLKQIADVTPVDTYLFGENLSEKLKSAKEVEKSAKDITKSNQSSSKSYVNNKEKFAGPPKNKSNLNYKTPSSKKNYPNTNLRKRGQESRTPRNQPYRRQRTQ